MLRLAALPCKLKTRGRGAGRDRGLGHSPDLCIAWKWTSKKKCIMKDNWTWRDGGMQSRKIKGVGPSHPHDHAHYYRLGKCNIFSSIYVFGICCFAEAYVVYITVPLLYLPRVSCLYGCFSFISASRIFFFAVNYTSIPPPGGEPS